MADDVQSLEPPAALLRVAREVTGGWLRRVVTDAMVEGGVDPAAYAGEVDSLVVGECERLVAALAELLTTDVDEQRTTPLSMYRHAVARPTTWLRSIGIEAPAPEPGAPPAATAADPYGLGPATWSDIDPAMHEAGLTWGAWKAMTVLRRRRDEGVR